MFYELRITWRTIRKEGFGSLFRKIRTYFGDLAAAARFLAARRPEAKPEAIIKFIWEAGRGLICPGQARSELSGLLHWMAGRPAPRAVLEIGTARGGTLFCWCAMAAPDAAVISLDLPGGIHGGGYPAWKILLYRRFARANQRMHLLRGNSHYPAMLDAVKKLVPPGGLDFLFIDGDHTLAGVRQDYEMYSPLVKSGGAIVFHDVCVHLAEYGCHVDELWSQLKQGREHWEFIENPAQGMFGIGVITVK
ncbi:MAG: class I SAM-dependent methyltransferase [Verrucomicrobiales bacterium]|nr:class I SAM-dependent methyltransferase [Verrucomicrobiales bacterium]